MSVNQIKKKFIGSDQVGAGQVLIEKNLAVRGVASDDSVVDLLKLNGSDEVFLKGIKVIDSSGLVPSAILPSYVDDVMEFANMAAFPLEGEQGKIYVALDTNKTYRWSGSAYIYITSGAVDSVNGETGVVVLDAGDIQMVSEAKSIESKLVELEGMVESEESRAMGEESRIEGKVDQEILDRQAVQAELDATQVGAGLETNGTYVPHTSENLALHTLGATSLKDADLKLDVALQSEINGVNNAILNVSIALEDEINRAGASEGLLSGRLDTLELDPVTKTYVDSQDALKVHKSGDTMTGPLTFMADPSATVAQPINEVGDYGMILNQNTGAFSKEASFNADGFHSTWGNGRLVTSTPDYIVIRHDGEDLSGATFTSESSILSNGAIFGKIDNNGYDGKIHLMAQEEASSMPMVKTFIPKATGAVAFDPATEVSTDVIQNDSVILTPEQIKISAVSSETWSDAHYVYNSVGLGDSEGISSGATPTNYYQSVSTQVIADRIKITGELNDTVDSVDGDGNPLTIGVGEDSFAQLSLHQLKFSSVKKGDSNWRVFGGMYDSIQSSLTNEGLLSTGVGPRNNPFTGNQAASTTLTGAAKVDSFTLARQYQDDGSSENCSTSSSGMFLEEYNGTTNQFKQFSFSTFDGIQARITGQGAPAHEAWMPTNAFDLTTKQYVDQEISALTSGGLGEVVADLAQEILDRQAADTTLQSNIDVEKGRIDAILLASDADKDSFAEIVSLINSVDTENDSVFGGYVSSNDARVLAVENSVAQEILDRTADVDAEEVRALAAEAAIQSALDVEEARALAAEQGLQEAIDEVVADLAQELLDRAADVNAEETRALAAEAVLDAAIDAEEVRALAAEAVLDAAIDAEEVRALAAEAALDGRLDAVEAVEWKDEKFTVTSAMITAGNLVLSFTPKARSVVAFVDRLALFEGASEDFMMSGATMTFAGEILPSGNQALSVGDVIRVKYQA